LGGPYRPCPPSNSKKEKKKLAYLLLPIKASGSVPGNIPAKDKYIYTLVLLIGFEYNGYFVTGAPFTNEVTVAALVIVWATLGRAAGI
jgi:hypothetical protein